MKTLLKGLIFFSLFFSGCAALTELTAETPGRRPDRAEVERRVAFLEEENARLSGEAQRLRLENERYRSREASILSELRDAQSREKELGERAERMEAARRETEKRLEEAENRLSEIVLGRQRSREELQRIRDDAANTLRGLGLFDAEVGDGYVLVSFPTVLSFGSEGVGIADGARPILRAMAGVLKRYPENDIIIRGHTDDVPISRIYDSNWELSAARALAVQRFMEDEGVDPMRMSIEGHGKYKPVASNATAEGRRQNRRVEIAVLGRQ